jgi:hypothetical protein
MHCFYDGKHFPSFNFKAEVYEDHPALLGNRRNLLQAISQARAGQQDPPHC